MYTYIHFIHISLSIYIYTHIHVSPSLSIYIYIYICIPSWSCGMNRHALSSDAHVRQSDCCPHAFMTALHASRSSYQVLLAACVSPGHC